MKVTVDRPWSALKVCLFLAAICLVIAVLGGLA